MSERDAPGPHMHRLVWLALGCSGIAIAAIAFTDPFPLEHDFAFRFAAAALLAGFALLFISAALRRVMRLSLEPETVETSTALMFFLFGKLSFLIAVFLLLGGLVVEWLLTSDYGRVLHPLLSVLVASLVYSVLGRALIDMASIIRRWPRHARGQ